MQNADYGAFASVAVNGVAFVLSVPAMPTGTAVAEAGVVVKTVRLRTGGAPQASVIGQQIAQKLPAGAQVLSQGRGHVVYRLKGEMRIRFDARGAKTLQGANPGRNHTTDNLAGVTKEGEVYVHEGRHRAIGAAKGDTIGPDLGGVSGQRHVLDFEFSEGAAESGGVYVRELSIDYTVPDVNAAEATRIWNAKNPL